MVKNYSRLEKENLPKDMDYPTYVVLDKTIKAYKKALKEKKTIEVRDVDKFLENL